MVRLVMFCFVILFSVEVALAQDHLLAVDLAEDHIDITTGFNGAKLMVFGVQEEEGDVVITFTGPRRSMVVRRMEKIGGIWVNGFGMNFEKIPLYYDYAFAGAEDDIALPEVLKKHEIGMGALRFSPAKKAGAQEIQEFQQALIRNKQQKRLFPQEPEKIVFLNKSFFRATFDIPPNVPTGDYKIKAFLFQNGKLRGVKEVSVRVAQVGMSASIHRYAHKNSLAYGIFCMIFSMAAGWFSNVIGRRV